MDSLTKTPTQEGTPDPINKKIIEEVGVIKDKRGLLRERLQKAEAQKDKVSAEVFQKIVSEYQSQILELEQELAKVKKTVGKELALLQKRETQVQQELSAHEKIVEESRFRLTLGEFTEEQHRATEEKEGGLISGFKEELSRLTLAVEEYQKLFEGEVLPSLADSKKREEPSASETAEISKKRKSKLTPDSDYLTLPEEDEFHESGTQTESDDAPTAKEEAGEKTEPKLKIPTLVQLDGGDEVQEFPVEGTLQIGRSPTNDIVISEPRVSRKHAQIEKRGTRYFLVDLDSSNGTFVHNKKIREHELESGDVLKIGGIGFKFKA